MIVSVINVIYKISSNILTDFFLLLSLYFTIALHSSLLIFFSIFNTLSTVILKQLITLRCNQLNETRARYHADSKSRCESRRLWESPRYTQRRKAAKCPRLNPHLRKECAMAATLHPRVLSRVFVSRGPVGSQVGIAGARTQVLVIVHKLTSLGQFLLVARGYTRCCRIRAILRARPCPYLLVPQTYFNHFVGRPFKTEAIAATCEEFLGETRCIPCIEIKKNVERDI